MLLEEKLFLWRQLKRQIIHLAIEKKKTQKNPGQLGGDFFAVCRKWDAPSIVLLH